MSFQCHHCEHDTESIHPVTYFRSNREIDEMLCDDCYYEWLQSIKG